MQQRLPFDAAETRQARATRAAAGPDEPSAGSEAGAADGSEQRPLRLEQLSARVRAAVDAVAGPVWVEGEVTGLSDRRHWWFALKDEASAGARFPGNANEVRIDAVIWSSRAARLSPDARAAMRDGGRVLVRGRLDYYPPQGRIRLVVDQVRPTGVGDLHARFERLRAALRAEGLFEAERKRSLPACPARLAVVTSGDGAALHDVRATAAARFPWTRLVLVDVRVQGERAAGEVVRALRGLDALARAGDPRAVDAILLTRGGGSLEDLWAFNEEAVVRAVAAVGVPLVAAIGHESDTLLAELAADARASTPTQAVMRLLPDRAELRQQLDVESRRLERRVRERVRTDRDRLSWLASRPCLRRPEAALRAPRERLHRRAGELAGAIRARLADERHRLDRAARQVAAITPRGRLDEPRRRLAAAARRLEAAGRTRLPRRARTDDLARRLDRAGRAALARRRREVHRLAGALELVDPEAVVRRGFTWTTDADGRVLRSAGEAAAAGEILTRFADGTVRSRVRAGEEDPADPPAAVE